MNEIKSTDYPEVYIDLGIDTGKLGCIMLDLEPIVISDIVNEDDYFYSDEQEFVQGNVSENVPHCTLLYGLMRSGLELKKHVDAVLMQWTIPTVKIDNVSFFYGKDNTYITVIALLDISPELTEANARLRLLPHIDTFGQYRPHMTLAYLKTESNWQSTVEQLNKKYAGKSIKSVAINYGSDPIVKAS